MIFLTALTKILYITSVDIITLRSKPSILKSLIKFIARDNKIGFNIKYALDDL